MTLPKLLLTIAVAGVLPAAGGSLRVQVDDIGLVGPDYFKRNGGYVSLTQNIAASGRSLLAQPRTNGEVHDSWVYTPEYGSVVVGATPPGRQVTVTNTPRVLGLTSEGLIRFTLSPRAHVSARKLARSRDPWQSVGTPYRR
jgi:hypothetical protein